MLWWNVELWKTVGAVIGTKLTNTNTNHTFQLLASSGDNVCNQEALFLMYFMCRTMVTFMGFIHSSPVLKMKKEMHLECSLETAMLKVSLLMCCLIVCVTEVMLNLEICRLKINDIIIMLTPNVKCTCTFAYMWFDCLICVCSKLNFVV